MTSQKGKGSWRARWLRGDFNKDEREEKQEPQKKLSDFEEDEK